jgi:hypothetical protein
MLLIIFGLDLALYVLNALTYSLCGERSGMMAHFKAIKEAAFSD